MIGDFFKIFYVWKRDDSSGHKPWEDPTLIGLIVGFMATVVAKYWGLKLGPDDQAGIVAMIGLFFRVISPHVGLRVQTSAEAEKTAAAPPAPSSIITPAQDAIEVARQVQEQNRSIDVDHGSS